METQGKRDFGGADGKRVVVVGGGQRDGETIGNGRATAILFARYGARVLVIDRDLDRAEATARAIREEGGEAHAFAADVGDEASAAVMAAQADAVLGGADVLINNVGTNRHDSHGNDLSVDAWDEIMAVNVKAAWLSSQAFIPLMRRDGGGVIVNTSSLAALNRGPYFAYGISKTALNAVTQRMAVENAPFNVRIHAVMPGPVQTPMFDSQIEAGLAREEFLRARAELLLDRAQKMPLRRLGTAWDIAHAMLFLASDQARYMTGVLIPVDGGAHVMTQSGCGKPE